MANLSPAVIAREFANDLTVEQQGSSTGALVGLFEWGPVNSPQLINNNTTLVNVFGKPSDAMYVDHMSAENFLSYTNRLFVVRTVPTTENAATTAAFNAGLGILDDTATSGSFIAEPNAYATNEVTIENEDDFNALAPTLETNNTDILFYAKYPGAYGNKLSVSMVSVGNFATWPYNNAFDFVDVNARDGVALVVLLDGEIVETFVGDSKDGTTSDSGGTNYIVEIVNRTSRFISMSEIDMLFDIGATTADINIALTPLTGGTEGVWGATAEDAGRINAWDLFDDVESTEVDLLVTAGASQTVAEHVVENVAGVRKDCVAFISPSFDDVVNITNISTVVTNVIAKRNLFNSSSYAVMDGNYKRQYDRYNDKYRWLPFNADIAGLHARTDDELDPWWAAAGFNRGHIKSVYKLAYSPKKAFRDELYKNGINPVVEFPGDGVILFGNKTMLASTSSLSRINVRRLFNVLKRSISRMARLQLFEFNDRQTRQVFLQAVEPFMRTVRARRGVFDYRVVCDRSNNTEEVIDNFQFVGDIFVKPAKAIETIYLNFIATKTGVDFEEITFNGDL